MRLSSIAKAVDDNLEAGLVVQSDDGFSPFSPAVLATAKRVPGVSEVSGVRFSTARGPGLGKPSVTGVDAATLPQLYKISIEEGGPGALRALQSGAPVAMAAKSFAESKKLEVGSTVQLLTPAQKTVSARIVGIYEDQGGLLANLTFDNKVLLRDFGERKDAFGLIGIAPGSDTQAVEQQVKAVLDRAFPATDVLTGEEFKDNQSGQVNQLLALIYALLSLAIIVSLFGIVNTLVLSITERTRELGMLRAVGMSRRQVRRLVRYEAVITALIGAILGTILGVIFAALVSRPLADEGFELAYPIGTLIILLVLAALAGVLAAIWPARRAAKLDVLRALAYE